MIGDDESRDEPRAEEGSGDAAEEREDLEASASAARVDADGEDGEDGEDGSGASPEEPGEESRPRGSAIAPRGRGRPASAERLYVVAYDIKSPRRWRRVFRTMKGYGRWLQLSVFQCRLTGRRRADLGAALEQLIHHHEDHVIILDLGPADQIDPRVESMGKSFTPIVRQAIIV